MIPEFDTLTFTPDELAMARDLRQKVIPSPELVRRDHCPHTEKCPDVKTCITYIAWYLRHANEIEGRGPMAHQRRQVSA